MYLLKSIHWDIERAALYKQFVGKKVLLIQKGLMYGRNVCSLH